MLGDNDTGPVPCDRETSHCAVLGDTRTCPGARMTSPPAGCPPHIWDHTRMWPRNVAPELPRGCSWFPPWSRAQIQPWGSGVSLESHPHPPALPPQLLPALNPQLGEWGRVLGEESITMETSWRCWCDQSLSHRPPLPAPCSASEFLLPVGRFSLRPRGNFSTVPAQPRREVPGGVCEAGEGNRVGRTGPSLELPEHPHMGPSLRRDGLIGMVTSLPVLPVLPVPHPGATLHVTPHDPYAPWEFSPDRGSP